MKKKYGVLLILIVVVVILTAVFLTGKKTTGSVQTSSGAETKQDGSASDILSEDESGNAAEILPEDESASEQVEEYVIELDEDETYDIN